MSCKGTDSWLLCTGGIRLSVLASADRLFVCSECAEDFDRLRSATSIRYYQRSLAATRRRPSFAVKAKLSLREHHSQSHVDVCERRSVFAPRIKPMAMSRKCCECRLDLNPYQANRCKHQGRGIQAYDRGQLFTDFAKLPDDRYESDQVTYAYNSTYDSDGSFDFEKELEPPTREQTADSLPSPDPVASQTDSGDLVLTGVSDYDSDTPPAAMPIESTPPRWTHHPLLRFNASLWRLS